jgi:8-oxo-dGTP pyrophosphatase MutT (NUDIX family)
MIKAAGILFLAKTGNALFLRRSALAFDCPGCWDFPGGGHEDGDATPEDTAIREAREEVGKVPAGPRAMLTRTKTTGSAASAAAGVGAPGVGLPVPPGAPTAAPTAAPTVEPRPPSASPSEGVDYATFLQRVEEEFVPTLNDEHDGWAWAPTDSPPEPLHPGCQVALDRLGWNELDIARAIADGRLTSPQHYENVSLFAIRITGTGVAYRQKFNEFAHRSPENYLNDEFLARCNGLPVIYVSRAQRPGFHPENSLLDPDEFVERVVGSVFLPYIAGDEVWGIAKIYDDAAAAEMEDKQLSTSPAVFFRDATVNSKATLEGGETLLIEGKPSLLDHVAICEQGVWDKGGEPSGIRSESREDSAMTAEEEAKKKADAEAAEKEKADAAAKDDAAKKKDAEEKEAKEKADAEEKEKAEKEKADAAAKDDADVGTKLDKMLSHVDTMMGKIDAIGKRVDALEGEDEPERLAADKAKKDAEEKEKADAAAKDDAKKRADAADTEVSRRIQAVEKIAKDAMSMAKPLADDDHARLADAWTRTDDVCTAFGVKTPRPMPGESSMQFRRRVAKSLQEHSKTWKAVDLSSAAFADEAAFGIAESQILAEAAAVARSPASVKPGELREITKTVRGHEVTEFVGDPRSWMDPLAGPVRTYVKGFANLDGKLPN